MEKKNGFTLIEISFALIIIGIISAGVMVGLRSFFGYHALEKTAWVLFKEFSSLRTKAMKNSCSVTVNFLSTTEFGVHTDLDDNPQELFYTKKLPPKITFGLPSKKAPTQAPKGVTLPSSGRFTSGTWNTSGIIIDNTAAAVVTTGGLFLCSPGFDKHTFCITVTDSTQIFKMFKWDGSAWIDLR